MRRSARYRPEHKHDGNFVDGDLVEEVVDGFLATDENDFGITRQNSNTSSHTRKRKLY